ncbi:MAG: ABC transporter permease [Chthoniobacter sp.]|uniref:ABC transporter permease n=1 Tax=Chthoniobacter sp. TaxID=2510640 RepID=UPI0032AAF1A7
MQKYSRELSVAMVLAALLLVLAVVAPAFYEPQPLLSRLAREAPTLIVACGVALVMVTRQIDISIGSVFALCGVCAGTLAAAGWPLVAVFSVTVLIGAALGAVNGALVAGLRLPSIVVTLATMVILREGLRWKQQGAFINLPDAWQWFGLNQRPGQITLIACAVVLLAALAWASRNLAGGRFLYAVGSNAEAARLAGLRPQWVTLAVFVFMGALAAWAALLNIVQSPQVDPKSGTGLELKAIAAAVVGGVAVSGGRGNLWGVFVAVLLLACINPALTYLHVEAYWEKAIQGAVILLAVIFDGLRNRRLITSGSV